MRILTGLVAVAGIAAAANADVVISEILGSTSSSDWEFIELANGGGSSVDITGWSIELWDSDVGSSGYGGADGGSAYFVTGTIVLAPGETWVLGNDLAQGGFPQPPFRFDEGLQSNAVENSSYTAILADGSSAIMDSILAVDGDVDDLGGANRAGSPITPGMTVGPDGDFLPAGWARTDLVGGHALLNFSTGDLADGSIEGGTPGIYQIPAPGALALLGLGGMVAARRRR
jgi:MYXO-CTERM domain-containing protein